jgi:hypothetical protein
MKSAQQQQQQQQQHVRVVYSLKFSPRHPPPSPEIFFVFFFVFRLSFRPGQKKAVREKDVLLVVVVVVVKHHPRRDVIICARFVVDGSDDGVRLSRRLLRALSHRGFRATDSDSTEKFECLDDAEIVRRFELFSHVHSGRGVCHPRKTGRD